MKDRTMHNYFEYLDIFFPLERNEVLTGLFEFPKLTFLTIKRTDVKVPTYKQWEKERVRNDINTK